MTKIAVLKCIYEQSRSTGSNREACLLIHYKCQVFQKYLYNCSCVTVFSLIRLTNTLRLFNLFNSEKVAKSIKLQNKEKRSVLSLQPNVHFGASLPTSNIIILITHGCVSRKKTNLDKENTSKRISNKEHEKEGCRRQNCRAVFSAGPGKQDWQSQGKRTVKHNNKTRDHC